MASDEQYISIWELRSCCDVRNRFRGDTGKANKLRHE